MSDQQNLLPLPEGIQYPAAYWHGFASAQHEEIASLRAQIAKDNSKLADTRKALERLCEAIEATEEHGAGADEDDCPICSAIRNARRKLGEEDRR